MEDFNQFCILDFPDSKVEELVLVKGRNVIEDSHFRFVSNKYEPLIRQAPFDESILRPSISGQYTMKLRALSHFSLDGQHEGRWIPYASRSIN